MKQRNQKMTKIMLSLGIVAVLLTGTTLAYLTSNTNSSTNVFTFADGLSAELVEPSWDTTDNDADGVPDASQGVVPGQQIAKDPTVRNLSTTDQQYVAIRVTFAKQDGTVLDEGDTATLLGLIDIDWNTTDFTRTNATDNNRVYCYNSVLNTKKNPAAQGDDTTRPLFNSVTFKSTITDTQMTWLKTQFPNGLYIDLDAYGVQASAFANAAAAQTDLTAGLPAQASVTFVAPTVAYQ